MIGKVIGVIVVVVFIAAILGQPAADWYKGYTVARNAIQPYEDKAIEQGLTTIQDSHLNDTITSYASEVVHK